MISAALGGRVVTQVVEGDKNFALLVSFPIDYRLKPEKLENKTRGAPRGLPPAPNRVGDNHPEF